MHVLRMMPTEENYSLVAINNVSQKISYHWHPSPQTYHMCANFQSPPSLPITQLQDSSEYTIVVVPGKCLRALKREDVFRAPPGTCAPHAKYYKNMMPDIPLALSQPCGRFFHEEDFEFAYLREGRCLFSRVKDVGDYGSC